MTLRSPFGPVVRLEEVTLNGHNLGTGGESSRVSPLDGHPGLVVKLYRPDSSARRDGARIDYLVADLDRLSPSDQTIAANTAWPLARVVDGTDTAGVVMAVAPERFYYTDPSRAGAPSQLVVDLLALPADRQTATGLHPATLTDRTRIAVNLVTVAAMLERRGIVYADWSYANVLWSQIDRTVFVLDMDSCSFGPRPYFRTANFEDPLTLEPSPVDTYTDRYRLALLVGRCLTGHRRFEEMLAALDHAPAGRLLRSILVAADRTVRPSANDLLNGLADGANVVGWRAVSSASGPKRTAPGPPRSSGPTPRARASRSTAPPTVPPIVPAIVPAMVPPMVPAGAVQSSAPAAPPAASHPGTAPAPSGLSLATALTATAVALLLLALCVFGLVKVF
jgi:hypothetical protein